MITVKRANLAGVIFTDVYCNSDMVGRIVHAQNQTFAVLDNGDVFKKPLAVFKKPLAVFGTLEEAKSFVTK